MIVVTGGAGFIGSNLIKGLNARGHTDILVVDELTNGKQFINLSDCDFAHYLDKADFLAQLTTGQRMPPIEAVFHQGACSSTTEWNGRYMMENNYAYSCALFHYCQAKQIPFIYASSAAVYGNGPNFIEQREYELPLNVYGFSKFQFDQYVRRYGVASASPVVGFRYFNVYGPREQHKGDMSSVVFKWHNQLLRGETLKLFGAHDGYDAGMQQRDFVFVDDVVSANLWFYDNPGHSGIYNVGGGAAVSFRSVAEAVIEFHGRGEIEYIPFPPHLHGVYQSHTQADNSQLREAGYLQEFTSVADGVKSYLTWLRDHPLFLEYQ